MYKQKTNKMRSNLYINQLPSDNLLVIIIIT